MASRTPTASAGFFTRTSTVRSAGSTGDGAETSRSSTVCSVTTSRLYNSDVGPKYNALKTSTASDSLLVSLNAGNGKATATYGSVSLDHGTCTYFGPPGGGSAGIGTTGGPP